MTVNLPVDSLVERVSRVRWVDLEGGTQASTTSLVLDALGVAAGAADAPSLPATAAALRRVAGSPDGTPGRVHVPWAGGFHGLVDAAYALSVAIHAWDFDDTHDEAVVHTACVALPAALMAAQECAAPGYRVPEGVVAGVEMLSRLSLALGPQRGVIRTAGLGAFGAAAAAARVLGLTPRATAAALSLALPAAVAPTSRQVVSESAVNKRHQPAGAASAGLTAAYLAAAGVEGPPGWFVGEHGLVQFVSSPERARAALERPGWEVDRLSLKPFPACRYAHAAVAGVLHLTGGRRRAEGSVRVHLPVGTAHAMVARPYERRGLPIVDAQFSVPWLVAAALHRGAVGLPEMRYEVLVDPRLEEIARTRVAVVQDKDPGESVMTPVEVHLETSAGTRTVEVDDLPGSPRRPLSRSEQLAKARGCLEVGGREPEQAERLARWVDDLPDVDAGDLAKQLRVLTPADEVVSDQEGSTGRAR
ncbi:MmgE/PrpD family protein [Micromonospora sp. NPDC005163]